MPTQIAFSLLDNPIWNALTTVRAPYSEGGELARRFVPEIGPLAGIREQSPEAYAALGEMLPPGEVAALFLDSEPDVPTGWRLHLHKPGDQMVFEGELEAPAVDLRIESLGEADVAEMLELTALTDPGPFRKRTIELGGFLGIRKDGRLAAMAGQRLALPGFTEVSAVCTHPDFRGRGYARALVTVVARKIRERGETPMLHAFSSNASAIRVYEALGFALRRRLDIVVVSPPAGEPGE
jgi:ribosomal protein S18 acetylase RimI-like enzyme